MPKFYERPNLISVIILVVILGIGGAYVLFTLSQRPELESFTVDDDYAFPYNFDRIERLVKLPAELEEISGLCRGFRPAEVFAVQDEAGELFLVNSITGEVVHTLRFDKDRDYEGVARRDRELFVLETDGDVHRFTYTDSVPEVQAEKFETDFSYRNDTEGICYDSITSTLLIVPKEQELNPPNDNDKRRGIYTYDLSTLELNGQPTYFVDALEIGKIVFGDGRDYPFKPSGVAVEPSTGYIFVLSSVGNVLVVIDRDSRIKHVELLEKGTFSQPEGIAFAENGDLYISSEGRGGRGIIATLRRSPPQATPNE
jgi:uncharacterized protein YjiK